jgi:hypothetical protein
MQKENFNIEGYIHARDDIWITISLLDSKNHHL